MNINLGNNIPTWNLACGAALLLLAGAAAYDRLTPQPDPEAAKGHRSREIAELEERVLASLAELERVQNSPAATFLGDAEATTPLVLEEVTRLANQQKLLVKSFRPQRPEPAEQVTRLRYTLLVEGPFPKIAALARSIGQDNKRLGLSLLQISSTDNATDRVNATFGVVAYSTNPPPPPRATTASARTTPDRNPATGQRNAQNTSGSLNNAAPQASQRENR